MSRTRSKATKESMARIRLVYSELEKYLRKLPPIARMTMGDLAREFATKYNLHEPHVRVMISFYFHTKYAIGEHDFMLSRGRTGGIQKMGYYKRNHT